MTTTTIYLLAIGLSSILIVIFVLILVNKSKQNKALKNQLEDYKTKYDGIIDVDKEIDNKKSEFSVIEKDLQDQVEEMKLSLTNLKVKYEKASDVFEDLSRQNNLLQDNLEIAEFGIYEPHFDFETSEIFKEKIKEIKTRQREMIKDKDAIWGGDNWTVNGSVREGRKMINKQIKLMLRAFNGECDSFISNVSWNNVNRMQERIEKSVDAINKMGETQGLEIRTQYVNLKLEELRLTYEFHQKKYEEKEEQRRIREQMREEEKARRDFEKAQKDAEKEEKMLQQAMKKATQAIEKATEEERAKYEQQLDELKAQLKEAEEKNQRAISMAQQTKSGHVYVISNIGSFGENVFKIGMTRRLEPMDRVNELGDASVPFKFDVHAMIYSDNAPELENTLHKTFTKKRLNHVNLRREYFDISLDEIQKVVLDNHGEIEFIKEPEAKEYRESLIIKEKLNSIKKERKKEQAFPTANELFELN